MVSKLRTRGSIDLLGYEGNEAILHFYIRNETMNIHQYVAAVMLIHTVLKGVC
jgi:hypothetical protein